MPRPHDRGCPHKGSPRFERGPILSSSYRNRLNRPIQADPPWPTPYEDFTTYTEVDAAARLTVDTNAITCTHFTRDDYGLVYRDYGIDHFGPTWKHELKTTCDCTPGKTTLYGMTATWAIANTIADLKDWSTLNAEAIAIIWQRIDPNLILYLQDFNTNNNQTHDFGVANQLFTTYPTIERTSETAVECRLYSDAGRTLLIDTLHITTSGGIRHRYIYGTAGWDVGSAGHVFYGTSEYLVL